MRRAFVFPLSWPVMRIAQIAPPWIAVPPPGYGGIEWIVSMLADGLAARGHDVTLFASGGSATAARLSSTFDPAPGPTAIGDTALETLHTFAADERVAEFDVIHDHTQNMGLGFGARAPVPVVHTIHNLLHEQTIRWYRALGERVNLVSISDSQRAPAPDLSYVGRVYNGIDLARHPFRSTKEDFLLFVGRANPDKGVHVAVEVAKRTGRKLVMVVAIKHDTERAYWEQQVVPTLSGAEEVLGEISLEEKADLMARTRALLFPISWPEPFGLVMAEANACGTPVLAFSAGAVPEVIADGENGFVVRDVEAMCEAVERCGDIDPGACRRRVERRFSAEAMVAGYEAVYERVLA